MKRMTSALTPAVGASLLIALILSIAPLRATPPSDSQIPSAPAGQPGGAQEAPRPISTDTDHGTALMLLDRIATVLDAAVKGKGSSSDVVGTTGSDDAGTLKVVIDRSALDEMRAELAQIRLLLQNEKK